MLDDVFEDLLHPRVIRHCARLLRNGHYCHAVQEGLKQVEIALKEKGGSQHYGRRLATLLKVDGKGLKLLTPFGPKMQDAAARYLDSVLEYYRNYATHEGGKIDRRSCLRALLAASELLELVGSSELSYHEIGGLQGLVDVGAFSSRHDVARLLRFLGDQWIVDDAVDGFFESVAEEGFTDTQMRSVIDVGLIAYEVSSLPQHREQNPDANEEIGVFRITALGHDALAEANGAEQRT